MDDFDSAELRPLGPVFLKGHIVYAFGSTAGGRIGYTGAWAKKHFGSRAEKNAFFAAVGERIGAEVPAGLSEKMTPDEILKLVG